MSWVIAGALCCLCLLGWAVPARAGALASWRFDGQQNRLEFNTNAAVQPRAQLISNPTRLVIDLPGTSVGRSPVNQPVGGAIARIRIDQFDLQTTRIVVELIPGYTLDPQAIQFQGLSPTQWTVQLPTPRPDGTASSLSSAPPPLTQEPPPLTQEPPPLTQEPSVTPPPPLDESMTQVEGLRVTADGLFLRTRGATPELEVKRSRDRRSITVAISNAVLSPQLPAGGVAVNRYGIGQMEFEQTNDKSPHVIVTLQVDSDSPNWLASASNLGGIVLIPQGGVAAIASSTHSDAERPPATVPAPPMPAVATISRVELDSSGSQLLIQTDRAVTASSRWQSGVYLLSLTPARLGDRVTSPSLPAGSPLLRLRLQQQDESTVVMTVQPAAGVRIGALNAVQTDLLALSLNRTSASLPQPNRPTPPSRPTPPIPPRTDPFAPIPTPSIPAGRIVVVLDPGHGGADVGAVGINNIHEADIVLPVAQQVAALLKNQGIEAVLTRNSDVEIDLEPRVSLAERVRANLFVSIHANSISLDRPDVNGVETYYYSSDRSEQLAEAVHGSVIQGTGMTDRGIRQARFYVLRNTTMPAVLVEIGFVTGNQDQPRLASADSRAQIAAAIARGILQYIQQNPR